MQAFSWEAQNGDPREASGGMNWLDFSYLDDGDRQDRGRGLCGAGRQTSFSGASGGTILGSTIPALDEFLLGGLLNLGGFGSGQIRSTLHARPLRTYTRDRPFACGARDGRSHGPRPGATRIERRSAVGEEAWSAESRPVARLRPLKIPGFESRPATKFLNRRAVRLGDLPDRGSPTQPPPSFSSDLACLATCEDRIG
jgi:hypothetical protein